MNEIREQLADAAIRWAKAKKAESSKDERKMQSTVSDRATQDRSLLEILTLAQQLPKEDQ